VSAGNGDHPTIDLLPPGRRSPVPIDMEIAPLIKAMWSLGIATDFSCQDMDGMVQIVMSIEDMRLFLTVVARNAAKSVARNAQGAGLGSDNWHLRLWSHGMGKGKHTVLHFAVGVLFPREQLAEVTKTLATLVNPPTAKHGGLRGACHPRPSPANSNSRSRPRRHAFASATASAPSSYRTG
jgi:hypothetical protein